MKATTKKHGMLGKRLIASLAEAVEAAERGQLEKLTVRKVTMPPVPKKFAAEDVKAIRDVVGVSQAVFAAMLGVSTVLVQGWEQGVRRPSHMACRLLEEMQRNPARWRRLVAA